MLYMRIYKLRLKRRRATILYPVYPTAVVPIKRPAIPPAPVLGITGGGVETVVVVDGGVGAGGGVGDGGGTLIVICFSHVADVVVTV